jgi:hypothetical protein
MIVSHLWNFFISTNQIVYLYKYMDNVLKLINFLKYTRGTPGRLPTPVEKWCATGTDSVVLFGACVL